MPWEIGDLIDPSVVPIENVPPQNIEAEQSVIGGMLQNRDAAILAMDILTPESFYRESHGFIFAAIAELIENSEPADIVTVADKLHNKGQLEKVGGMSYLSSLAVSVPTVANIEYYARIVYEKACLRNLISAATQVAQLGFETEMKLSDILDKAEQLIFNISQRDNIKHFYSTKEIMSDSFDYVENLYERKEFITGLPTGFTDLDTMTTGLQPSDLIIVAARPGMGKTSLCLNIATNVAINHNIPVAIFSLETSRTQLVLRMLCSEARVNSHKLRSGYLSQNDWPNLINMAGKISSSPIFIDDTPGINIHELRARARRLKSKQDMGLIIVDYIQLMQGSRNRRIENRQQEISEISRSLKELSRELNVPLIATSQLSRAVEQRMDKRPILSDLRESGAIEQDADLVLFIYREGYYRRKHKAKWRFGREEEDEDEIEEEKSNVAEIIIGKQRNGPIGTVELAFLEEYTRFAPLEKNINYVG